MPEYNVSASDLSQKLLITILSRLNEGVIIVDTKRNAVHINNAAEEITGYKNSEVSGEPLESFLKLVDDSGEILVDTYIPAPEIFFDGVAYSKEKLILIKKDSSNTLVNI